MIRVEILIGMEDVIVLEFSDWGLKFGNEGREWRMVFRLGV